ncbi:ROK family protein [Microbacterium hominis]|uniref:ROK family protein n=1 Tax=Microbacterium hominis TaxID=162426 RepID=A0A7D4Q6U8_9MICO|nr:ROK family protein [Microbacterium hominis]QKJ18519.1 ROK family protein [Microbacterium hominis]
MRIAAIDFGGTAVKLGVFESRRMVAAEEAPIVGGRVDLEAVARRLDVLLEGHRPDFAGIAVPGIIDPTGTRLLAAHGKYGDLHDVDLSAWSVEQFGCGAAVENDARAALIGEVADGSARGARDAALIVLGTGIGTAAVVDGRVVRGSHGHGGILGGHVTVDVSGPRCACGNIGCAEAIASTWALSADAKAGRLALGPVLSERLSVAGSIGIRDLIETREEPESASLLDRYIAVWAAAVVTHCHAFDPEVIVVTGGVMRSAGVILPALRGIVHQNLWSSSYRPRFVVPEAPSTSVLRGIAALAADMDSDNTNEGRQ